MITSYDNAEQPQSRRDLKKKKSSLNSLAGDGDQGS